MLNRCSIYVHFCEVKSARRASTNSNWRNNLCSIAVVSMYTFAKSKVRDELLPIVIGEITRARPLTSWKIWRIFKRKGGVADLASP